MSIIIEKSKCEFLFQIKLKEQNIDNFNAWENTCLVNERQFNENNKGQDVWTVCYLFFQEKALVYKTKIMQGEALDF